MKLKKCFVSVLVILLSSNVAISGPPPGKGNSGNYKPSGWNDYTPPGWNKGNKKGWNDYNSPGWNKGNKKGWSNNN